MNDQVAQLELLCQQLYESDDLATRQQAEKTLVAFAASPNSLPQCQMVLERSQSHYALLLAASTLTKIVTNQNSNLSSQDRLQLRNYVLQYLSSRSGSLASFVTQSMVQLVARLTKYGWLDSDKNKVFIFRDLLEEVGKFLQGSVQHCEMGIQLLRELIQEMNTLESARSIAKHRKVASSFRDEMLFPIFSLACTLLRQMNIQDEQQHQLINWLLKLSLACLCFDFIGNSGDESSDDIATVQIPTAWRPLFVDLSTVQLHFNLVHSLPPKLAAGATSCLVQLASARRSLFSNMERAQYLEQLVKGVQGILESPQCLTDADCYHEFCRLLVRLKSNYQIGELIRLENYPQFLQMVAKFTISSLQSWQFSANSVYYLLSLWQRMVASVPFIKQQDAHLLNTYVPEITKVYITTRLEMVETIIREDIDDPLDDDTSLGQQLDQLSILAKCDYQQTCELLISLFDNTVRLYHDLLQMTTRNNEELAIREGQLAWLVHMIGHVMGVRISHNNSAEYDTMDGQLVCRVLQLMDLSDTQLRQRGNEHLDIAIIGFFEQFRKTFIGEMMQRSTQIYRFLGERLGLNDETAVLDVIVRKIVTNLKLWTRSCNIIKSSLQLLQDLSVGFSSVRKLYKLESMQFVLNNHTPEQFPFLSIGASSQVDMRCRTMFYSALGRLLLVELREDDEKLRQFMSPITDTLEQLRTVMTAGQQQILDEEQIKHMIVGCARDLRGILLAFTSKQSYVMFFDWIYPDYITIFIDSLRLWYLYPFVTVPVLKLIAEFSNNRSQRLMFDVTSPKGVLLFQEASKTIVTFGQCALTMNSMNEDEVYERKLKGVLICFNILRTTLCGSFVNFGVMKLYGDTALDNALNVFIKLLLSLPLKHLLDFPKLSIAYYTLLETLTQYHMEFISSLEPDVIIYILSSISEGLTSLDSSVCTGCCSTLDHMLTYLFRKRSKPLSPLLSNSAFLQLPDARPEILQEILSTVLHTVMFEKCRIQWSMSRPLLVLILLNEEYFKTLHDSVVSSQPLEKQNAMLLCFENLMDGIEFNLTVRNRDKFTQNLSVFRRDISASPKDTTTLTNIINVNSDMMT